MFFDVLRGTWVEQEEGFFNMCLDCEKNVRTDPSTSASRAKTAIESFATIILKRNGIRIPDDIDKRKEKNLETSIERIKRCSKEKFINKFQTDLMHDVRKLGNRSTHVDSNGTLEVDIEVKGATELFEQFYRLVVSVVKKIPTNTVKLVEKGQNLEDWLPIGGYEVVDIMSKKDKTEDKIPTYKCVLSENKKVYAIIRRYKKDDKDDVRQIRDILAMQELKINFANVSHKPVESEEIDISSKCEYRYIKYSTAKDTILLSQAIEFKELKITSSNVLQIMENIVDILNSLTDIGNGVSLHHRGLNPECVFITPGIKKYYVQICHFECSKVKDKSVYMPPEVRDDSILNITDPDWEQIDVYSCAVMLLYISYRTTPNIAKLTEWLDKLSKYFTPEFIKITKDILTSPYGSRPTLNEYLKAIRKEVTLNE